MQYLTLSRSGKLKASLLMLFSVVSLSMYSQERTIGYDAEIGGGSTDLPFWLYSNNYGKYSKDSFLFGDFGMYTPYKNGTESRKLDFSAGFEGSASLGEDKNRISLEQLYFGLGYRKLALDLGIVHPEIVYDGLSSTGGDILFSTNSKSLPGINLRTRDYIKVFPFLSFKASFGDYRMIDTRWCGSKTFLHHNFLDLRFQLSPKLAMNLGISHYAQWAGNSPRYGRLPHSFKDYVRAVAAQSGGEDAPDGDRINRLGNHLGSEFLKFSYHADKWNGEFYYQNLFEDGSGARFKNCPDGIYGIYFQRKKNPKWFKSAVFEFYHTTSQSGATHNSLNTGKVIGGNDNYFNNWVYRSGWTYYGRTIGAPFFTPCEKSEDGIVYGVHNNRFRVYYLGIMGELPAQLEYRLRMSFGKNFGSYSSRFMDAEGNRICKEQFSMALEVTTAEYRKLPFQISLAMGYDAGQFLKKHNFGIQLRLIKKGIF